MSDLSNVKVGDKLVVRGWNCFDIVSVTRLTKTLVICGERKFTKQGLVPGQVTYYKYNASVATSEDIMSVRIQKAVNKWHRFMITKKNIDAVEALLKNHTN